MVTYDSHFVVASLAAERRQSLAKAEGRGFGYKQAMSRRATKESFAATAAYGSLGIEPTAFRDCCRNAEVRNFPLLSEEGWTRHQQNIAKPPLWSGRGGDPIPQNFVEVEHHPVCAS
jgi:hypothetical protein